MEVVRPAGIEKKAFESLLSMQN